MEVAGQADGARFDQIKTLQKHLGDINDYESARRIVAREVAGERISARLREQQRKKVRLFRHHWNDEFAGKESEWVNGLAHASK